MFRSNVAILCRRRDEGGHLRALHFCVSEMGPYENKRRDMHGTFKIAFADFFVSLFDLAPLVFIVDNYMNIYMSILSYFFLHSPSFLAL